MYLKRIELLGFKSFGQKTEMDFQQGITAIVGPNGCGKSNIVDSFRWALGEQSIKSLRGAKMEDVIFNGTSVRKPLSVAEVSLTFDNQDGFINIDFQEVTVARRIYRSGESEYLINKRPCRLRDIQDLFVDTGIGKEAYSIISQGKIDILLSTRPEDRRSVFEEAAGIFKYKNRKREAERRLKETEDNILRIGDVVAELEVQIAPLEEQAKVAREYLKLKKHLDRLITSLLFADATTLKNRLRRLTEGLKNCHGKIEDQARIMTREESRLTAERWELEKKTETVQELQKKLSGVNEERERARGQRELVKEKLNALAGQLKKNKEEEAEVREELGGAAALAGELKKREALLREELAAFNRDLEGLASEYQAEEKAAGGQEAASLEALKDRLQGGQRHLEKEISALEVKKSFLQDRMRLLKEESESLVLEKYKVNNDLSLQEVELEGLRKEAGRLDGHLAEAARKRLELGERAEAGERELAGLREEARGLREKIMVLQELESTFAGYYQGVRNLLQGKKTGSPQCRGIHGPVADLIQVKEEHRTAVETALAASLQDLVMEDEKSTAEAIEYLKKNRLGRATFLPLTVIKGRLLEKDRLPRGILGLAVELVRCEPGYRQVMDFLLGKTLVCRDLKSAQEAAREAGFRYKVVTLQGEVIYSGGAVTGGSKRQKDTFLLTRKQELESLEEKRGALKQALERLTGETASLKSGREEAARLQEELEGKCREAKAALSGAESRMENLKASGMDIGRRVAENKKGQRRAAAELQELEELEGRLREEVAGVLQEASMTREKLDRVRERLASGQGALSDLREKITALKIDRAGGEEKLRHALEKAREVRQEEEAKEGQLQKILQERKEFLQKEHTLQEALEEGEAGLALLDRDRDELAGSMRALQEEQESLRLDSMAHEEEIRKIREELQELKREASQLEVQKVKAETEFAALKDRMLEEFGLHFGEIREEDVEPLGKMALRSGIEESREKIAALGTVNTGAIEEFERIGERIRFLSEQKEDLLAGKGSLNKIIGEIDEKMAKKFMATFGEINQEFNKIFRRLFGGGMAYLELVDRENPLESGIEIIAKPPGKKMQMISLLSGGERALTAISLLFALMLVKPAPFCVLDEIDTSLDESNVERYCEFLQELDNKTQFVLVTHKRQTMGIADILYGVTMEEPGISKIISVKMREKAV